MNDRPDRARVQYIVHNQLWRITPSSRMIPRLRAQAPCHRVVNHKPIGWQWVTLIVSFMICIWPVYIVRLADATQILMSRAFM